jgi:hypothetical protein
MGEHREPTADECSAGAVVQLTDTLRGYACWYPQMGGYVGKAVAVVPDDSGCIDVYVWHDGQFPFSGEDEGRGRPTSPVELHHCDPDQFIRFGQLLDGLEPL